MGVVGVDEWKEWYMLKSYKQMVAKSSLKKHVKAFCDGVGVKDFCIKVDDIINLNFEVTHCYYY